jgi:hypothetical protein
VSVVWVHPPRPVDGDRGGASRRGGRGGGRRGAGDGDGDSDGSDDDGGGDVYAEVLSLSRGGTPLGRALFPLMRGMQARVLFYPRLPSG